MVRCLPRSGTFVREDWEDRVIRNHMVLLKPDLPWAGRFKELLARHVPGIRLARGFKRGVFELRETLVLQNDRDQYLDLAPLLPEGFLEGDRFFARPFVGFGDGRRRLFGLPFIFSPRVVLFNPGILERCGLPPPSPHWDWDDFIRYVIALRRHLPDEQVLNYGDHPFYWMSFIFRAGGRLFDRMPDGTVEVRVDLPETLRGLELIRELRSALRCPPRQYYTGPEPFLEGGMALAFTDREFCSRLWRERRTAWGAAPMPTVPGGCDAMAQSTNLVCVRRECADTALASKYIQFMLGDDAQSFIASERYGLPIQKRAAMASVDAEDPRDTLFLSQMNQMSAEYNMDSPVMTSMLQDGLSRILWSDRPPEAELRRLADAFRVFMDIRNARLRDEEQTARLTRRRSQRRTSKAVDAAMAAGPTGPGL